MTAAQTDVMTSEQRSRCMSRIRGKNTKPEIALRKALWQRGLRYRLGYKLPGKPDITFVAPQVVIFVDGCFWHGCPTHSVKPKANRKFWRNKLSGNVKRDKEVNQQLSNIGWKVLRFWEHEVEEDVEAVADQIVAELAG